MDIKFVMSVLSRLPVAVVPYEDTPLFIDRLKHMGFTIDEAAEYCGCMEEFSPALDEKTAIDRMAAIKAKVDARKQ
jgi:hypothetical protein